MGGLSASSGVGEMQASIRGMVNKAMKQINELKKQQLDQQALDQRHLNASQREAQEDRRQLEQYYRDQLNQLLNSSSNFTDFDNTTVPAWLLNLNNKTNLSSNANPSRLTTPSSLSVSGSASPPTVSGSASPSTVSGSASPSTVSGSALPSTVSGTVSGTVSSGTISGSGSGSASNSSGVQMVDSADPPPVNNSPGQATPEPDSSFHLLQAANAANANSQTLSLPGVPAPTSQAASSSSSPLWSFSSSPPLWPTQITEEGPNPLSDYPVIAQLV